MFQRTTIALAASAALILSGSVSAAAAEPAASPPRTAAAVTPEKGRITALAPTSLRVAGQSSGALVGQIAPSFAWAPHDSGRAQAQTGYEIRVREVTARSNEGLADWWDSGRVTSARSAGVVFGGRALKADHTYEWAVRTWNRDRQRSAWSAGQRFDVGLLAPSDWGSSWITASDGHLVRTEFTVAKKVARARLYVAAQGIAVSSLNGALVDPDRVVDNSATDFSKRVVYRSQDVTATVTRGVNVLGLVAGKGSSTVDPVVTAQVSVEYADGTRAVFGTGADSSTATGPITSEDFYYGEAFDARRQRPGWDTASFDASSWQKADVVAKAGGDGTPALEADTTPVDRVTKTVQPVSVTTIGSGRVYDFGQNYVGQTELIAKAASGTTAVVTKGEILDADGHVSTKNISFADSDPVRQRDSYTFDASGKQTYTPTTNYAGFRYAEVTGLPRTAKLTLTARVGGNDVTQTGSFTTSDPLLNEIQDAVVQTQLNDLQNGMPLDCPTREKHGWMGDAGDTDVEAMANFDMQSFYDKWLGDIRTSQNGDGSVPSVSPVQGRQNEFRTDPAWGSAFPQIVWDSYQNYGDSSVLTENYDEVKAWVDYLPTISDDDHIVVSSPTSWGDDWLSTVSTPHQFIQTGFALLDTRLLAQMAKALGKTADAERYAALAAEIAEGFNRTYFTADSNVYGAGTQFAYAMPIVLGIVPGGHEKAVTDKLVADVAAHDDHVTSGFAGTTFVYQALAKTGNDDVALRVAQRTDGPSFGYMVNQGPGTIWEKWPNSTSPDGTSSKDHIGLAGSIGQWYYQQLAGIQPGSAGWKTFALAPNVVGDLTHVKAKQDTVRGTIASEWRRKGDTLTYDATVPVGSTATVTLPATTSRAVTEGGVPLASADGVAVKASSGGTVTLEVGSGSYHFVVRGTAEKLVTALDAAKALQAQVARLAMSRDLSKTAAASLRTDIETVSSNATRALALLPTSTPQAAARAVEAVDAATRIQTTVAGKGVSRAARSSLTPKADAIAATLSDVASSLTGIAVSVDPGSSRPFLPGDAVDLAVTVRNRGTKTIRDIGVTASLPDGWKPVAPSDPAIVALAPKQSRTVHVTATVPADALPGDVAATANVRFDYSGTAITSVTPVTLAVASAAQVSVSAEPGTVSPGDETVATVRVTNTGSTPVSGTVALDVPDGWGAPEATSEITVAPGTTRTVTREVAIPLTLASQGYSIGATLARDGITEATGTTSVTGTVAAPVDAVDHIDLGDGASEQSHALTATETSGTGSEAGLTRRYSGSATDSSFTFELAVPVGKPFVVTGIETFDGPRIKDYTVSIGDSVVQNVHLETSSAAQSSMAYQFVVDDPAVLSSTGTVTLTVRHGKTSQWDPSLADVWSSEIG